MLQARVVLIFKKGDRSDMANYRPISLLNSIYKIFAAIIQKRLAEGLDVYLQKTQYGFRQKKGTADALHYVRRMIDKGEMTNSKTLLVLLDWEKAFDKVLHDRLLEALRRMNVPEKLVKIIQAMYTDIKFNVEMEGRASEWTRQETGIRQGCPLSPYLFIIVMTVLFHDVHDQDKIRTGRQRVTGTIGDEVLYADDTICITQTVAAMNRLLAAIEAEGKYYGLNLNKKKCEYLGFGNPGPVKFANGTRMSTIHEVKYLGCLLNDKADPEKDVKKRISDCMITMNRLHIFFRNSNNSVRQKLLVWDAVIRSKLMYGLESTMMNIGVLSKIDAFQLKGLRKILKVKTAYHDRDMSNEQVYRLANQKFQRRDGEEIIKLSEFHKERRIVLMAKLLTLRDQDPAARVTFNPETLRTHDYGTRRRGRPRLPWVHCTFNDCWNKAKELFPEAKRWGSLELDKQQHRDLLFRLADVYNKKHKFVTTPLHA